MSTGDDWFMMRMKLRVTVISIGLFNMKGISYGCIDTHGLLFWE